MLETRIAPATVSWIGGAGDWDTPADWSTKSIPQPSDDVIIDVNAIVTLTGGLSLQGGTLNIAAGTLEFHGNSSLAGTGTVTLGGSGALTTFGTSKVTIGQGITIHGGATTGSASGGIFGNFANSGTIDSDGGGSGRFITIDGSAFTNDGIVEATKGSTLNVTGSWTNDPGGQLSIEDGSTLSLDGTWSNTNPAPLQVGSGGSLSLSGTWSNSAPISVSGNSTLNASGTWSNTEPITTDDSAVNLAGVWSNSSIISATDNSTLNLNGTWTNNLDGAISVSSSTLSFNGTWQNDGTLTSTGASVVNLESTYTLANLGNYTRDSNGKDLFVLAGTLNLAGETLDNSAGPGPWVLDNATIDGGTINLGLATTGFGTTSTLQNVTLAGTLSFGDSNTIGVAGTGLTMAGGVIDVSSNGLLNFSGTQTLSGTGTVNFFYTSRVGGGNISVSGTSSTLTIGPNVILQGTDASINTGSNVLDNQGTINANIDDPSFSFTIASGSGGSWSNDGTVEATNGATLSLSGTWTNQSDGTLSVGSSILGINGTWQNQGTFASTGASIVYLGGTYTLANLGSYTRDSAGKDLFVLSGTLNLAGQTLDNSAGPGQWVLDNVTIDGGTISASLTSNNSSAIFGHETSTLQDVTLAGTLSFVREDTIEVAGAGLTLAGGVINATGDGQLNFSGTQTLSGTGTINFFYTSGLGGGNINVSGTGSKLTIGPNVTLQGTDASLNAGSNILDNRGTINANIDDPPFSIAIASGSGGSWSNDGTVEATDAGAVNLNGSWTNTGTLEATNSSTLSLGGSWMNTGTIGEISSTINVGGTIETSTIGKLSGSGGIISFTGILTNDGILTLDGSGISPEYSLSGGTISGGTIDTPNGGLLVATGKGGTLDGVTLAGTLLVGQVQGTYVDVTDGLTLSNATVTLEGNGAVDFLDNEELSGSGAVDFADNLSPSGMQKGLYVPMAGTTLTIAPGIGADGDSGFIGSTSGGFVTNDGTIASDGGGTITVQGDTNYANGTLTGGTWQAVGASTLRLIGANITTNAATILLDGGSAHLFSDTKTTDALASFTSNSAGGSFAIQDGATFSSSQSFTNAGTIGIGGGSTFASGPGGSYTQTGGATVLNSGTLGSSGTQVQLQGGTLSGPGTVNGSLTNAGEIDLGSSPGTLTINGSYTQTAAGTLSLKVGGAAAGNQFDQVDVAGPASLDGTLNVSLINGFAPAAEETFDVLNFAASGGAFSVFNPPKIGGIPAFVTSTTSTSLDLIAATSAPDLAAGDSSFAQTTGTTGQAVTVNYTVNNQGTVAATGSWLDSVYLSTDTTLSADDQLLGRVAHNGDVAGMSGYTGTLTARLPGVIDGNFHVIIVADSGMQVPDADRSNNIAASATTLPVSTQALSIGTQVSGTIANGQDIYYRLVLPAGVDLNVSANYAVKDEAFVGISPGAVPTTSMFAQANLDPTNLNPQILMNQVQGGDYYLLLAGQPGAGTGQTFSLVATLRQFEVDTFSVTEAGNTGTITMPVSGSHFTPKTTVRLVLPNSTPIPAQSVIFHDSNDLTVTFDLTGVPEGTYDLQAVDGTHIATAAQTFQVIAGGLPGELGAVMIVAPAQVKVGEPIDVQVQADNSGTTSAPAPVYAVSASDFSTVSPTPPSDTSQLTIADVSSTVAPLTTADLGSFVYIPSPQAAHVVSTFTLDGYGAVDPSGTAIDWSTPSIKAGLKPADISDVAWNAIYPTLTANFGGTLGTFENALRADLLYLESLNESVTSVGQLLALEYLRAEDEEPTPTLATSTDLGVPTPGLALSLSRSYIQSISGRYQLGAFGYGWTFIGDDSISPAPGGSQAPAGSLIVQQQGADTVFNPGSGGSYKAPPGDADSLTLMNGSYVLVNTSGSAEIFNSNGSFHELVDSNGNSIIAGYTGSQLTSLTHSSGASLTFTYNAQGRIATATTSTGQKVTYTYDASGAYLLSATSEDGSVSYAYVMTSSNALRLHALQSITNPDGTHTYFTYDSLGRLVNQQNDNGTGSLSYVYFTPGGYTVTNAVGLTTTILFDENGQRVAVTDPSGNTYGYVYDAERNLQETVLPDGSTVQYAYDPSGNVTTQTDALGNTIESTYNQQFSTLSSLNDANGNLTTYTDNSQGDLTQITAADGGTTQYVPNPNGEVQQLIDANGRATSYIYNAFGEVTTETFSNGVEYSFTYDARGNLLTATDASGTTTFVYDDPNNPDLVTSVTYPNGMFLEYSYYAGGLLKQLNENGYVVNYNYDASGRMASLTDGSGMTIVTYQYNTADQLTSEDMGNGTYTIYTYTADGQIASLINYAPNGTVNSEFIYSYDFRGRVAATTTLNGTTTYGYDADSELTSVTLPTGQSIAYGYDAMGNRTTVTENGATTSYTTNDVNEYTAIGGAAYSYDKDGNLIGTTGAGGTTTYTYNVQNQLIEVQTPTDTWTYTYDALGNLIASTHNGQATQYLVSPGMGSVVGEYDENGNLIASYTYGIGLTTQVSASGAAAYYDFDATGNTAGLTGPAGSYVDSYSYLPYGEVSSSSGSVPNAFQYDGQAGVMTEGNGLDFMHARFYDVAGGRFLNRDPAGLTGGTNLYGYARNDPVLLSDPSGLIPVDPISFADHFFRAFLNSFPEGVTEEQFYYLFQQADEAGELLYNAILASENAALDAQLDALGLSETAESVAVEAVGTSEFGTSVSAIDSGLSAVITESGTSAAAIGAGVAGAVAAGLLIGGGVGYGIAKFWDAHDPDSLIAFGSLVNSGLSFLTFGLLDLTPQIAKPVSTEQVDPKDPNFISGFAGSGSQGYISPATSLPYVIGFENEPTASAPAQVVEVTQQLDSNLDWSTFQLGDFGFGGQDYSVPAGRTTFSTTIDARSTVGVYVQVTAQFNELTGVVTWTFTSLDPTTFDVPVGDPEEGFLPPDVTDPEGDGWATYTVQPKATDTTGTVINAQATVIFDAGLSDQSSLNTAPIFNTIDAGVPTSSVAPLPAFSPASFTVNWSGQDDSGGSGIATYDVYVSDDGGLFTLWQSATTQTSASYTGQAGHTYGFYSVATDNVGNTQSTLTTAQATTQVDATPPTSSVAALPAFSPATFTLTWSGSDNPGGSGLASYTIYVSDNGGAFQAIPGLTDTTQTSASYTGQAGHTYGFYSIATDNVGNVEAAPGSPEATTTIQFATTLTVTSSSANDTSTYGDRVTFTAVLAVSGSSVAPAAGESITFMDGATSLGTGTLSGTGVATFTTTATQLTAGGHTITAVYGGDTDFAGTSGTLQDGQTVNKASPTFSQLTPSQTIAAGTASITLSGVLAAGALVPAEEAITIAAGIASTTATVNGDGTFSATLTTSGLAASSGAYVITYSYGGDTNFNGANDNSTALTVKPGGRTDVTSQVSTSQSGFFYNRPDRLFYGSLTITNISNAAIAGSLVFQLQGLTAGVTLKYAAVTLGGQTYQLPVDNSDPSNPTITLSRSLLASLAPGQSIVLSERFSDPGLALIDFTTKVFSDPTIL